MTLFYWALPFFNKIINQYIALDPETHAALAQFNQCVFEVEIMQLNLHFFMLFNDNRITLAKEHKTKADASIKGKPLALLNMLQSTTVNFSDEVVIKGDMELAQQIKQLFNRMDIDWEEHLSKLTGDFIAHNIASKAKQVKNWFKKSRYSTEQNIIEFLQQESSQLVPRNECNYFIDEVARLHNDCERLAARVNRLKQQWGN